MRVKGVRWTTIAEGDANAHEESDDDEAKTSAEGVNESEPVNAALRRHSTAQWAVMWSHTEGLWILQGVATLTSVTNRRPIR